jgi:hypothetical protein
MSYEAEVLAALDLEGDSFESLHVNFASNLVQIPAY